MSCAVPVVYRRTTVDGTHVYRMLPARRDHLDVGWADSAAASVRRDVLAKTPLTSEEKRLIVRTFYKLQKAIESGSYESALNEFRLVYRGRSSDLVWAFPVWSDKHEWAQQMMAELQEEIGGSVWAAELPHPRPEHPDGSEL
jgi:hypothetical protein